MLEVIVLLMVNTGSNVLVFRGRSVTTTPLVLKSWNGNQRVTMPPIVKTV